MVTCPEVSGVRDRTPVGSEPCSPHFSEFATPPYMKWARDFQHLMDDPKGIQLFQEFLDREGVGDCLKFWLACRGLKKKGDDRALLKKLFNVIYKNFIKNKIIKLSETTRNALKNQKKTGESEEWLTGCIFDEAQREIEELLTTGFYDNFLKSEIYLDYLQQMQHECLASGGVDHATSESKGNEMNQYFDQLPTVHEDSELETSFARLKLAKNQHDRPLTGCQTLPANNCQKPNGTNQRHVQYPSLSNPQHHSYFKAKSMPTPPNPYHVKYSFNHLKYSTFLPNSAQDSELQSLSSGFTTDDTASCVNDKMDSKSGAQTKKQMKQQYYQIKQNVKQNPEFVGPAVPKSRQIDPKGKSMSVSAEKNPAEFYKLLCEKLAEHQHTQQFINMLVPNDSESNHNCTSPSANHLNANKNNHLSNVREIIKQKKIAPFEPIAEDNQSILDKHIQRVWDETPNGTPNKPGLVSPPNNSKAIVGGDFAGQNSKNASAFRNTLVANSESALDTPIILIFHYPHEKTPYIIKQYEKNVTLKKLKQMMPKKGNWRYFFKRKCEPEKELVNSDYVFEEIDNDNDILPICENKIEIKIA